MTNQQADFREQDPVASASATLARADAELARTGARWVKLDGFRHIDVWYGYPDAPRSLLSRLWAHLKLVFR